MNHPLQLAREVFEVHGMQLTTRAQRAVAVALGLAAYPSNCDDAFIARGMRTTNTVLALLTDRYDLDFSECDRELGEYSETIADEIIERELERRGFNGVTLPSIDPFDEWRTGQVNYDGLLTGDPDGYVEMLNDEPEVFRIAVQKASESNRNIVETFDLLEACSELPFTGSVFQDGELTLGKLQNELAKYRTLEPYHDNQQVILRFEGNRIRIRHFGLLDGVAYSEGVAEPSQLILQISDASPFVASSIVQEFEDLINWHFVSERDIHRFLEEHPELLLGDDYASLQSELILDHEAGDFIPDFFAELVTTGYSDIMDLKKPNEALIVGRKSRRGFSAAVHSAVYQVRHYRDYFDSKRRRDAIYAKYGIRVFKPKIAVVIGRTPPPHQLPELVAAQRSLCDAEIVTYDDVIAKARRRAVTVAGE